MVKVAPLPFLFYFIFMQGVSYSQPMGNNLVTEPSRLQQVVALSSRIGTYPISCFF